MVRSLCSILLSISCIWSFSQQEIFLVDEQENPIANVSLYFTQTRIAYLSDVNGYINIKHELQNGQVFRVEHLSYKALELKIPLLKDTLVLELNSYPLIAFNVKSESATQIIQKAISKIKLNYPQEENYSLGNYIQVHKENNTYVRYIEAVVDAKHAGYRPEIKQNQEESFFVNELRRSYNYEKNGDQHGDHLVDLFLENPIQYLEKGILNPKNLNQYTWSIKTDEVVYYEIEFRNKSWNLLKNYSGLIKINKTNYAMEYIRIQEYPNRTTNTETKGNWEFLNGWYEIQFTKKKELYYVDVSNKWYFHIVWNEYNPTKQDYLVEELFVWKSIHYKTDKKLKYSLSSNLYSKEQHIGQYLEVKTINKELRKDLEHKYSLEYQFQHP